MKDGGKTGPLDAAGSDEDGPTEGALRSLKSALELWIAQGRESALVRWFDRALDPEGVPARLEVPAWPEALASILRAVEARPEGWPERLDAQVEGWVRACLRFARTDGTPAFQASDPPHDVAGVLRRWSERLSDAGFATVLDWWFAGGSRERHAPPPLPADARPDRPLAILRANWTRDGDFIAVDHRAPGATTALELVAQGRPWLGPAWSHPGPALAAAASRAKPSVWVTQSTADLAEWTFKVGPARVTRTAVLLRGRRLALLAEQWDGPGDPGASSWTLAPGVEPKPLDDRGLGLTRPRCRTVPELIPVGIPRAAVGQAGPGPSLRVEDGAVVLRKSSGLARCWRALLVSWEPARARKKLDWKPLTVTEDRHVCGEDRAVAMRVTWGRQDTLVVYRSLDSPGTRAFLGHQTTARFLVGLFNEAGDLESLIKVDA